MSSRRRHRRSKPRNSVRILQILLMVMFLAIGVAATVILSGDLREYAEGEKLYAALQSIGIMGQAEGSSKINISELSAAQVENISADNIENIIDFNALRAVNQDVVGWVFIPGTQVNYPVVRSRDNKEYLNTTFDGKKNSAGAIFLDYANAADWSATHNIIYGHNMKNGTMFADLLKYKQKDFFDEHRTIILYTPQRVIKLRVISSYAAEADDVQRKVSFSGDEMRRYAQDILSRGKFSPNIDPAKINALYSFATCSYEWDDTRTWVHAVESGTI